MFGLLPFASCNASSPAGAAFRGPAARSAPGTPSVALLLSGGLHLAALALFLAAASRSGLEEPDGIEIRAFFQPPGIVITTPPPPSTAGSSIAQPRVGTIAPVNVLDQDLQRSLEDLFSGIGPKEGIRPDAPVQTGGGGQNGPPPTENPVVVNPDLPTDQYDEYPVVVSAPEPEYPPIAREAGVEGRVVVEALVGRDGRVRRVVVKEGNAMLAESASKAVKTWRFKPARWRGQAVTAWVAVPVQFRLH